MFCWVSWLGFHASFYNKARMIVLHFDLKTSRLLRVQKQMIAVKLLIIPLGRLLRNRACRATDELGFVPLSKTGSELLFELISQHYERGSTMITSNLPFGGVDRNLWPRTPDRSTA